MTEQNSQQITLPLTGDAAWAPVGNETLWTVEVAPGLFRLDNVPAFLYGYAVGDVITRTGRHFSASGNLTLRVVVPTPDPLDGVRAVLTAFEAIGVGGEGMGQFGIACLNVTPDRFDAALALLHARVWADGWMFEEGNAPLAWTTKRARLGWPTGDDEA